MFGSVLNEKSKLPFSLKFYPQMFSLKEIDRLTEKKTKKKQVNPASLVDHGKIKILLMISLFFGEQFKSIALSDRLDLTLCHTLCNWVLGFLWRRKQVFDEALKQLVIEHRSCSRLFRHPPL